MSLKEFCTQENFAWETELYTAYHYCNSEGNNKTIFEYRVPFTQQKEAEFLAKYNYAASDRIKFYENLLRCVQQELSVSNYLNQANVPSILTFSKVEQDRDENEVAYIRMETEKVYPIMQHLIKGSIPISTLTSALYRLVIIFRDIWKEDRNVVHRGFDMNEVYINESERIMLGGFYYASCPAVSGYPDYLPQRPVNLAQILLQGENGSQATDLLSLSIAAWNLFSGNPVDAKLTSSRLVFPRFASEEMAETLLIGLSGNENNCTAFRRRFNECRKSFLKDEYADVRIPVIEERLKQFQIDYV